MKVHYADDQFDGALHAWCGRGTKAVTIEEFEATAPELRCKVCERDWFPSGQPDWHLRAAIEEFERCKQQTAPTASAQR